MTSNYVPNDWPVDPRAPRPDPVPRLQIDLSIDHAQTSRMTDLLTELLMRTKQLELAVGRLVAQGVTTMATQADIQAKLAILHDDVEADTTVATSVETLLTGQTQQLKDLAKQLADAIAANDPAALQAVSDALDAITATNEATRAKTIAAVLANTPAAPPPAA